MTRQLTPVPFVNVRVARQLSRSPSNDEQAYALFAAINGLLEDAAYQMQDLEFYLRDPVDPRQAASVFALTIKDFLSYSLTDSYSIFLDSDKPPSHLPPPTDPLFVFDGRTLPLPTISENDIKTEETETVLSPAVVAAAVELSPPPAPAPAPLATPPHRPAVAPSAPKPAKGKGKAKATPLHPAPKGKGEENVTVVTEFS